MIRVVVPENMLRPGSAFNFPLPKEVRSAVAISKGVEKVTMESTGPMASWLKYDSQKKVFVADNVPEGAQPVKVQISVGDLKWTVVISSESLDNSSSKPNQRNH